jgi:hypothetical protein
MDLSTFKSTLQADSPPPGITGCLAALWYDAKQDWERAHTVAQDIEDRDGAWVHAYLHRKEGDASNARYWYNRAGRPMPTGAFEKEWEEIVTRLLNATRANRTDSHP